MEQDKEAGTGNDPAGSTIVYDVGFKPEEGTETESAEPENEVDYDKFEIEKKFPHMKGWEMIGFHRQLGAGEPIRLNTQVNVT
jgi:hypothetical protein